jgi:hypothetical protein
MGNTNWPVEDPCESQSCLQFYSFGCMLSLTDVLGLYVSNIFIFVLLSLVLSASTQVHYIAQPEMSKYISQPPPILLTSNKKGSWSSGTTLAPHTKALPETWHLTRVPRQSLALSRGLCGSRPSVAEC